MDAIEVTNEYGFKQVVDEEGRPICAQCHACVVPNRGQGTLCDHCAYEAIRECEHDYFDGMRAVK